MFGSLHYLGGDIQDFAADKTCSLCAQTQGILMERDISHVLCSLLLEEIFWCLGHHFQYSHATIFVNAGNITSGQWDSLVVVENGQMNVGGFRLSLSDVLRRDSWPVTSCPWSRNRQRDQERLEGYAERPRSCLYIAYSCTSTENGTLCPT